MFEFIAVPFGYLLDFLYRITGNYGVSLILFGIVVQLVLLPITAKSKKSMMKMSRLTPKIQAIKEKYPNDQAKQNEAIGQLQREEGAGMGCGGCLWSLLPMLILLPLYQVVRQPLTYMLHLSGDQITVIMDTLKNAGVSLGSVGYDQVAAAAAMGLHTEALSAALPELSATVLQGLDLTFLGGIDLGLIPEWKFWGDTWSWTWAFIGAALIPLLSAGSQVLSMLLSQKMNNSVVTDEKGLQDKETAKKSQSAQSGKMMMYMMPLMSLFIGFSVPAALSLYWFVGGVVRMVEDYFLTKHYRKVYDAEDAIRLEKALAAEREEAEKERLRAQRRAENPDGITDNTSKKKLQKAQRAEEAANKAAAAKEYAAKKGVVIEEEEAPKAMSGIAERPFCKGRNYNPNRYHSRSTEE